MQYAQQTLLLAALLLASASWFQAHEGELEVPVTIKALNGSGVVLEFRAIGTRLTFRPASAAN
jgi:hypothetical protein